MPLSGFFLLPTVITMTIGDVLFRSGFFPSKGQAIRAIQQRGVRVNGELVDSFNEPLEPGDFINFISFPNALDMMKEHGRTLLLLSHGKRRRSLVKVVVDKIQVLAGEGR